MKLFPLDETRHQFYAQEVVYTLETIDSQNSASSNQRRTRRQNRGTRNTACKHPNPKQTRSSSNKSPSVRTRPSETYRKSWPPLAREANKTRKQLIKPRNKRNELTEADTSCRSFIIFFKLVTLTTYLQKGKFVPILKEIVESSQIISKTRFLLTDFSSR